MKMREQDLSRFLAANEAKLSYRSFMDEMLNQERMTPEDFVLGSILMPGEKDPRAVVVGVHAMERGTYRLNVGGQQILAIAIWTLGISYVAEEVISHPVILSEGTVEPFEEDGIDGTVVVIEGTRYTLVFEAGFTYIRVKTVWDNNFEEFHSQPNSAVIHIKGNPIVNCM